ncbi:MAG: pantoate--beta-alanine ligase [Deltaproteobacteria bacterium]|nr:pantoate--beta-alanine ligase [Deltaproteobacteria bacterium]
MVVIEDIATMKAYALDIKSKGKIIGFVPTMGYFHEGHLMLMRMAKKISDHLIISIFVNPTQFEAGEDLDKYPRDMERDKNLASSAGVECIFAPSAKEMYPEDYTTYVTVENLTNRLCGVSRPHHFRGVATIVVKLFNIIEPDVAVFGKKDFQQLTVIKQMVKDLNMNVKIVGHPTVRESDGLAMSSRNVYLSLDEREKALILNKSLQHVKNLFKAGLRDASKIKESVIQMISSEKGCDIDYVEIVDPERLSPVNTIEDKAIVALAVRIGSTRLIDNIVLGEQC